MRIQYFFMGYENMLRLGLKVLIIELFSKLLCDKGSAKPCRMVAEEG